MAPPTPPPRGEKGGRGERGAVLALARLRLFPGRSPSADGVWRAKKGEVLSKIFALPWPPPCCLPPVTSACCQCLRWSAWGPCAAFSPSALSRGARAWRRCGSLSSIPGTPSVLRVLLRLLMRCCLHPTALVPAAGTALVFGCCRGSRRARHLTTALGCLPEQCQW